MATTPLAVLLALSLPALAQDPADHKGRVAPTPAAPTAPPRGAAEASECQSLKDQMQKLAQRNAWDGVERLYNREPSKDGVQGPGYAKLGCSDPDALFTAAQAARFQGNTREYLRRLLAANKACKELACPQATADALSAEAVAFLCANGPADPPWTLEAKRKKELEKKAKKDGADVGPLIVRPEGFFEPDKTKALQAANARFWEDLQFSGYLPTGAYTVDGQSRSISADSAKLLQVWGLPCPK